MWKQKRKIGDALKQKGKNKKCFVKTTHRGSCDESIQYNWIKRDKIDNEINKWFLLCWSEVNKINKQTNE